MLKETPETDRKLRAVAVASWGQERRLEFIEFRLLWDGKINRSELVDFFGISIQQASLDLARYMEFAPTNLHYDRSQKVYLASPSIAPVLCRPDSQAFLSQLALQAAEAGQTALSFLGWRPTCDLVKYPTRSIRPQTLMQVLWAIRDHSDVELSYQSMRSPALCRRWIAPHAVAFDGCRWHVRAWCHESKAFKDFVFARIQRVHGMRETKIDSKNDLRWHTYTKVLLRPRRELSESQRAAVESEFGMNDGKLEVEIREALVFYYLRQLRLDPDVDSLATGQTLELGNRDALAPLIAEALRKKNPEKISVPT